jgi:hypothetical protein
MSWNQIGSDIAGATAGDNFGTDVAINGDGTIAAFSAPLGDAGGTDSGEVRVFQYSDSSWSLLGSTIPGETAGDKLNKIKLNNAGTRLIVGEVLNGSGSGSTSQGSVKIYDYDSGDDSWGIVGSEINGATGSQFGSDVSINSAGDRIVIGARYWDNSGAASTNKGYVETYSYDGSSWNLLGSRIEGPYNKTIFGASVDMNQAGDRIVVGAPNADADGAANSDNEGAFLVYEYSGGSWSQLGSAIYGDSGNDRFGYSTSINNAGDRVFITSRSDSYAKAYSYNGSAWVQLGSTITVNSTNNLYGDMNGDGDVIIIGDWETSSSTGEVKVYQYTSDWGVVSSAIAGGATGDKFGSNVAINGQGDYIAVGAKEALSTKGETYVYYNSSLSSNSSDVSTSNVETASASTTLKNELVSDLNSIAGVSISASDISASTTIVSTQDNVDYEFTITIVNVDLSDLSGAEQTSLINVFKSRYATDLSIDSSRITITLREGSIEADVEIGSTPAGSGNGKVTVKLNGKITIKGTGKITVK